MSATDPSRAFGAVIGKALGFSSAVGAWSRCWWHSSEHLNDLINDIGKSNGGALAIAGDLLGTAADFGGGIGLVVDAVSFLVSLFDGGDKIQQKRLQKHGLWKETAVSERAAATGPEERRPVIFLKIELGAASTADANAEKIETFGGRIEVRDEDGLCASFGLEPVEEPALLAAHAAQGTFRGALRSGTPPPRAALHRAEVQVAGDLVDAAELRVVIGILYALAAQAPAGGTVASATIAPLLERRFAMVALGHAPPACAVDDAPLPVAPLEPRIREVV
jgi:hypothetical protein